MNSNLAAERLSTKKAELKNVRAFIEENLNSSELSIELICTKLEISRSNLYRLFPKGRGIKAYILRERIKKVKSALSKRGVPPKIVELASYWQFSDASHLCRTFRQTYGLTPGSMQALKTLKSAKKTKSATAATDYTNINLTGILAPDIKR